MNDVLEAMPPLSPLNFFALTADARYSAATPSAKQLFRLFSLPDTTELLGEEKFATLALSWNEEGLHIAALIAKPFEEALYPHFSQGDALELFIDTRNLKTAGFITRFCHHFLFLPQAVQGIQAQELTRFRTEDTHPLCDPADISVTAAFTKKDYQLLISIPAQCLHGYNPAQCDHIGFNFRCHRTGGRPQHFCLSSSDYAIEQHPRLWASIRMKGALNLSQ